MNFVCFTNMKILFNIVILVSLSQQLLAQITFSEIMFDVSTNEYHDEFIEVFNRSYVDSVDVTGWVFSDSSGIDPILAHSGGIKIGPRCYALILDGSYFENSTTYDSIITDTLVILRIGDNSFGKNGLANSEAEYLTIRDSTDHILTAYRYTIGNIPGHSDEKINLDEPDDSLNWADSNIEGGTPGRINSVAPPMFDFGFVEESFIFPIILKAMEPIIFSLEIMDYGVKLIEDSLEIIVHSDLNGDQVFQSDELLIVRKRIPTTAQKIVFEWDYPSAGEHRICAALVFDKDEKPENNLISTTVRVLESQLSLHLNEVKFLTEKNEPEWIELVNLGKGEILLKGWSVSDLSDTASIEDPFYLKPGDFIVLCEDTLSEFYQLNVEKMIILNNFPTLNDQEDNILLLDPMGRWVERFRYDRLWLENEDYRLPSLERIHPLLFENKPENWGPCTSVMKATPGSINSIYSKPEHRGSGIIASPNPFSPDHDGHDDVTIISGYFPENNARIKAKIYDIRGRLIQILKDNVYSGSHFNLVWDGSDFNGRVSRIGVYIVFLQVINDRLGILREMKTTVVLAKKL